MPEIEVSEHSPRRISRMKTKYLFGIAAVAAAVGFTAQARAGWSVNLSLGVPLPPPPVIVYTPPVHRAPPPVMYSPAPVVVGRPAYREYRPTVIVRGYEHEGYRYDRGGRNWNRRDWDRRDWDHRDGGRYHEDQGRGRGGDNHDRGHNDHR